MRKGTFKLGSVLIPQLCESAYRLKVYCGTFKCFQPNAIVKLEDKSMDQGECIIRLKGIKALIYNMYNEDEGIDDMKYACWLISNEIRECVDFLEKTN